MKKSLFLLVIINLVFSVLICFLLSCKKAEQTNKIIVWHWMSDREEIFKALSDKYKELTGIEVVFQLFAPSEAYSQKVKTAAQTKTLPDIFGVLGDKRDLASFVKAGHLLDLTSYMEENNKEWYNRFFPKAVAVNSFLENNEFGAAKGIYGVPIDVTTAQILYNKDLLKKVGVTEKNLPKTWEDFIQLGKNLSSKGISGFVSGWGEIWLIDIFARSYAFNIMGFEKVMDTFRGKVSYTDPDWIKVFKLFEEMRNVGMFVPGIVTMVNKVAEQTFATEKCSLAFNGSWCINVYKQMNPNLNYGVLRMPKVNKNNPIPVWGGPGNSFMINARSKNKEEAVKFLKWLTEEEQQKFLAQQTGNIPANKSCIKYIPSISKDFIEDLLKDNTFHLNTLPVSELSEVYLAFGKEIQHIITGEKTPQQAAEAVEAVKKKEMAKLETK